MKVDAGLLAKQRFQPFINCLLQLLSASSKDEGVPVRPPHMPYLV